MAIKINNVNVIDNSSNFIGAGLTATKIYANNSLGVSGDLLSSTGVGITWRTPSAGFSTVTEFLSSGTWTKPTGANFVMVELYGAGGGGGSGRRGSGNKRCGGSGGGGGSYVTETYKASDLTATVTVTIGAGGIGGTSVTVDLTNGNPGTNGGNSTFGSYLTAYGGARGKGGIAGNSIDGGGGGGVFGAGQDNAGGSPILGIGGGVSYDFEPFGGAFYKGGTNQRTTDSGYGGGAGGGDTNNNNGGKSLFGGGGGGGGGGIDNNDITLINPGSGGSGRIGVGGTGATAVASGVGATGGNGGIACGGGGGAASSNTFNSGAGGNGGDGYCIVYSW